MPVVEERPPPAAILEALESLALRLPSERPRYLAEGLWRTESTVVDDFEACRTRLSQREAIITYAKGQPTQRLTYGELGSVVDRIAGALIELGVQPFEVVSVQLPNCWQFSAIALACSKIGAVLNPIIPIHRRREVSFIAELVASRVVFASARFRNFDYGRMYRDIAEDVDTLEHIVLLGAEGPAADARSFEDFVLDVPWEDRHAAALRERRPHPDQPADLQFTSGTTGEPKSVGHTFNTQAARVAALHEALELRQDDRVLMSSTLAHSTGLLYGHLTPLTKGMTAVYQDVWDAEQAVDIIATEGVTWTFGSTAFVLDLIAAQGRRSQPLTTLRYFVCGGAPIPAAVVAEADRVLGARLMAVWGMTENGAATCTRVSDPFDAAAESDGHPCRGMELKIVDDVGRECPPGQEGHLLSRGASQMLGYAFRPERTKEAVDSEGWLRTGDLGRLDEEGRLRITGRAKELIIRGGENVPVVEVEAVLFSHPAVAELVLVGYPDPRLGERACAIVVPTDPAEPPTLETLTNHLEAEGVSKTYWPERLRVVSSLPRTMSGKVQRFKLQEVAKSVETYE